MGFVVNNTIKCGLLDLLCPHTCRGCGCLGEVLCERCKKYIISQRQVICPICKKTFAKTPEKVITMQNVAKMAKNKLNKQESCSCTSCESDFVGLWAFGWRESALKKLIEQSKYQSVRAAIDVLAELMDVAIPDLGNDVVVVPLPTIGKHIRERGLDHTWLLAKKLAKRRGWRVRKALGRAVDTVQVGTKVAEREEQARQAYCLNGLFDKESRYLLLDDVWTTGASMRAAAEVMRESGVKELYGAVVGVSRPKPVNGG